MSNRQLDDAREAAFDRELAAALGISVDDLTDLEYDLDPHSAGEIHIGYNVNFAVDACNPAILAKVKGLVNGQWVRIGLIGGE